MKVVIASGGKGTRISSVYPDIPKPLIPINGIPILEREIISLRDQGFCDFILTVGYMADKIIEYFGNGERLNVSIEYFVEEIPLGNVGALFKIKEKLNGDFLFLIADALFDVDFHRLVRFHKKKGGLATIFTHPNSHPYDSSIVVADENNMVERWITKEEKRPENYRNRVNAGLHVLNSEIFSLCDVDPEIIGTEVEGNLFKVDLDRQLLKPLCGSGKLYCYDSPEYCKDMGTPDRLKKVSYDLLNGIVSGKNLMNRQRAVFFDIHELAAIEQKGNLVLKDDFPEIVRKINNSRFVSVLLIGENDMNWSINDIKDKIDMLLSKKGVFLDLMYSKGTLDDMINQSSSDYNIDISNSYLISEKKARSSIRKIAMSGLSAVIADLY